MSYKIDFTTLPKASVLAAGNINGTYNITTKGLIYAVAEFQCEGTGDGKMRINASGMSGNVYQLEGSQYGNWVKGQSHSVVFCDANDSVTLTKALAGTGFDPQRGLAFFVPCNW